MRWSCGLVAPMVALAVLGWWVVYGHSENVRVLSCQDLRHLVGGCCNGTCVAVPNCGSTTKCSNDDPECQSAEDVGNDCSEPESYTKTDNPQSCNNTGPATNCYWQNWMSKVQLDCQNTAPCVCTALSKSYVCNVGDYEGWTPTPPVANYYPSEPAVSGGCWGTKYSK